MKKQASTDLASAINRQAHRLAAQSFLAYRDTLRAMAHQAIADGKGVDGAKEVVLGVELTPQPRRG